jgi:hypothetical protein
MVSVRRVLGAFVLCVAFVGGACILGPKQDDPSNATTGVDSGLGGADVGLDVGSSDTRGITDAQHDATPTTDTSALDAPGDTTPASDGDAADSTEDAPEGSTSDGGAPTDGGVE